MKTPTIHHVESLSANKQKQLFEIVCNEFVSSSPIHTALKINPRDYSNYLRDDWESYVHMGPLGRHGSLVAIDPDSDEICGCIITADFPTRFNDFDNKPVKQQMVSALLQELEQLYLGDSCSDEKSLLVDLALVPRQYSNQGIYQLLRHKIHEVAAKSGFEIIYGELTSAHTQHVCINKLHHQTVAEVLYREFSFAGSRPFAHILEPPSVKLVMASLPAF